ncbi:MAG: GntR family transcriptional regulator [Anaerolineae bacterium]
MEARPLRRNVLAGSLAEQVYRTLRAEIILGHYPAGTKLVELDLAQKLGTSQGTIREGLQRLEREGLVERHTHRATFVTEVDTEAMYELFVIRSTIEGIALRRAMARIQDPELAQLESLWVSMRDAADKDDIADLVEHDLEFHRFICRCSHSSVLLSTWQPLYSQIQRFMVQTHPRYFQDLHSLADTHMPVLDAIRSGDVDDAVRVLQEHIMLIWSWLNANSPEPKGASIEPS